MLKLSESSRVPTLGAAVIAPYSLAVVGTDDVIRGVNSHTPTSSGTARECHLWGWLHASASEQDSDMLQPVGQIIVPSRRPCCVQVNNRNPLPQGRKGRPIQHSPNWRRKLHPDTRWKRAFGFASYGWHAIKRSESYLCRNLNMKLKKFKQRKGNSETCPRFKWIS